MLERYHESRERQMNKKIHGLAHFQHENAIYPQNRSLHAEHVPLSDVMLHSSIQLLAYQIHHEKGGGALDNWLQAEHILKDTQR